MRSLLDIQASLSELLETDDLSVNVSNNSSLSVEATNSPFNTMSREQRKEAADRAALKAYNDYTESEQLDRISITFISAETKYVIVTYQSVIDSFTYKNRDLRKLAEDLE